MGQICRSRQQVTDAYPRAIVPKVTMETIGPQMMTQAREATLRPQQQAG